MAFEVHPVTVDKSQRTVKTPKYFRKTGGPSYLTWNEFSFRSRIIAPTDYDPGTRGYRITLAGRCLRRTRLLRCQRLCAGRHAGVQW